MSIEGLLTIKLAYTNAEVNQAHIHSTRPLNAVKLLIGKTPEQCLATVPLLFNICGNAQAYAAHTAIRQALDCDPEPAADVARQMLVKMETLREHGWRILLDWSRFVGQKAEGRPFAGVMQLMQRCKRLLFEQGDAFGIDSQPASNYSALEPLIEDLENWVDELIFQGGMQSWLMLETEAQLLKWLKQNSSLPAALISYVYRQSWQDIGHNAIECLPELESRSLQQQLSENPAFGHNPLWFGRCYETGALGRQQQLPLLLDLTARYRNGLLSRLVARLSELASTLACLRHLVEQLDGVSFQHRDYVVDPSWGLAQVQAARGLLIHSVRILEGRIQHYQIVAPTEWNFHPDGVVVESLKQLRTTDQRILQKQAEWLINAIDPCVQYQIEITGSE